MRNTDVIPTWTAPSYIHILQNHTLVEVGKDRWGTSSPTPSVKAESPRAGDTGTSPSE